jgi:hypothetical protein
VEVLEEQPGLQPDTVVAALAATLGCVVAAWASWNAWRRFSMSRMDHMSAQSEEYGLRIPASRFGS